MTLTFQKEDFIGNQFTSNDDCAICRAASRELGMKVSAAAYYFSGWTGDMAYTGQRVVSYSIPDTYGAPEFERAKKAIAKGEFKPFSIEVQEIEFNEKLLEY